MKLRQGRKRWCEGACAAASVLLAFALAGATPLAFAEANDEAIEEGALAPDESAFALGHVVIACIDDELASDGEAADVSEEAVQAEAATRARDLTMGVPQVRAYRVTNQGEASYIRLSSHTLLRNLDHVNDLAVTEDVEEAGDLADEAADTEQLDAEVEDTKDVEDTEDEPGDETPDGLWRLADDGFWYRSQPLEVGETITVYVSVEIPFEEEWIAALSTGAAGVVTETLDMQALQARNKAIDLTSADPWGVGGVDGRPAEDGASFDKEGGQR